MSGGLPALTNTLRPSCVRNFLLSENWALLWGMEYRGEGLGSTPALLLNKRDYFLKSRYSGVSSTLFWKTAVRVLSPKRKATVTPAVQWWREIYICRDSALVASCRVKGTPASSNARHIWTSLPPLWVGFKIILMSWAEIMGPHSRLIFKTL